MTLKQHQLTRTVFAGMLYFVLVFGAGFILGPIRVLLIVPRLGERIAELIEAPVMFVVILFAAKLVVRKFRVPYAIGYRLLMGLLTFGLGLAFEVMLVLKLRGLTLSEYFRGRDPVASAVYYSLLVFCAILPLFVELKSPAAAHND